MTDLPQYTEAELAILARYSPTAASALETRSASRRAAASGRRSRALAAATTLLAQWTDGDPRRSAPRGAALVALLAVAYELGAEREA